MAGSLFERLTLGEQAEQLTEDESIRLHLMRMLSTRQGAVQALPDYGLPDLNDLSLSRSELELNCATVIKSCIDKYEPRLIGALVSPIEIEESSFQMAFSIKAQKKGEDGKLSPWQWSLSLDNGKIFM